MSILTSTNPSQNYAPLAEILCTTTDDITRMALSAKLEQKSWAALPLSQRLAHLKTFRDQFPLNKIDLAKTISEEMGMPISQSTPLIDRAVDYMDWSLDNAQSCLAPEITFENDTEINEVHRIPYGVCASIAPWNFPATNFVWACFQHLCAGNTVLYKPSEETPIFAQKLESMITAANLPQNILNIIIGDAEQAIHMLEQDIQMINFTGSTAIGRKIHATAAKKLIPATLEMGGSDPAVIFEDADLDLATEEIYNARYRNCGQICCATKRLIVHKNIAQLAAQKIVDKLQTKIVGDAINQGTDIGPLVSKKQQSALILQVEDARQKGAKILIGGNVPDDLYGAYYQPTLITDVTKDMKIWHEETFGPVLPIMTFETYDEAIALANDTEYGLGASIFTNDKKIAEKALHDIEAGMIRHNTTQYNKTCNPFGGVKNSGLGRENGKYGFEDVTQIKIIAREK